MAKAPRSKLTLRKDHRGWLVEVLQREQVEREGFGLIYVTAALPRAVRGNHYHARKTEWFCVIQGRGRLVLEDMAGGEREEIVMDAKDMSTVRIPPHTAHAIQNTGEGEMLLLAYIDEPFNPEDPDTHPREVIRIKNQ